MLRNQKGLTLVEILAVVSLLSLVTLLGSSIHLFSQKQAHNQSTKIKNESDVRLAMNIITKEIRKASTVKVEVKEKNNFILTLNETDIYRLDQQSIRKNDTVIISNIKSFTVNAENANKDTTLNKTNYFLIADNKISLTITAGKNAENSGSTLSTIVYIRRGSQ
ncbi:hypothetical protein A8F94_07455 [Bacillus sp. FJAT-27225]|uniref:prepilin-type N-terminal cleavage/methylation domain-containing protein n=1 Tax=Bacillus sp. FJAT-27225 TaxID=1743144 RepID=UPI00080C313E|nr:prepilin-type N-terminal cleavage/methylation domain-containing protein [Bacillus sp. FJAT-27225]OCA87683.1 hypothetical protein A8F94_07455 [Bacillus sp. FJAT-27225]